MGFHGLFKRGFYFESALGVVSVARRLRRGSEQARRQAVGYPRAKPVDNREGASGAVVQPVDLALPRGGGPGEGRKKPPTDGRGFGSRLLEPIVRLEGYFRCPGFPRFCSEELPFCFRHRLFISLLFPPGRGFRHLLSPRDLDPESCGRFCFERGLSLRPSPLRYQLHHYRCHSVVNRLALSD